MPEITVQRHGNRWAVREPGAESPSAEYETREAAEMAARRLAGDGNVTVREDDASGLSEASPDAVKTPDERAPSSTAKDASGERLARSSAAGL